MSAYLFYKYSTIALTCFILSLTLCSPFLIFLSSTPWNDTIKCHSQSRMTLFFQKKMPLSLRSFHFWTQLFSLHRQIFPIHISYKANVLILDGADSRCRWGQFSCHCCPFRVSQPSVVISTDTGWCDRENKNVQELDTFILGETRFACSLCRLTSVKCWTSTGWGDSYIILSIHYMAKRLWTTDHQNYAC